jgi:integrase
VLFRSNKAKRQRANKTQTHVRKPKIRPIILSKMQEKVLAKPEPDPSWQPVLPGELASAGEAANRAASHSRFSDYHLRRAAHTLRRQQADLALFARFLEAMQVLSGDFMQDPEAWRGVTWGLVEGFAKWQLQEGYTVSSVNVRISTLKAYARLAMQAGTLPPQEYALIRAVQGYNRRETQRINQRRPLQRRGLKKAAPVPLTHEQAGALKTHPDTPQGRRDTLMMCLLLDHGLRVGELAALRAESLDLDSGLMRFNRPKVGKDQVHRLSRDTLRAARLYAGLGDMPEAGAPLLRRSLKNGHLSTAGMSDRAITKRVNTLGEEHGIFGLSAHDCRHYWATNAARHGTDPFVLQEAGGWSSLAMPRRYVEEQQISNQGVKSGDEE